VRVDIACVAASPAAFAAAVTEREAKGRAAVGNPAATDSPMSATCDVRAAGIPETAAAPGTDGSWENSDDGAVAKAAEAGVSDESGEADSAPGSPADIALGSPPAIADGREPSCAPCGGPGAAADPAADANPPAIRSGSVTGWSTGRDGGSNRLMGVALAMFVIETSGAKAPGEAGVGVAGAESVAGAGAAGGSAANEGEAGVASGTAVNEVNASGDDIRGRPVPVVAASAAGLLASAPTSPAG